MSPPSDPVRSESDLVVDAVVSASRALVGMAARSLADTGEEVTLSQYRSLVVLASRGPQSVGELAEAVAVTAPTASRMVDRLVRKGLVRRRTSSSDRRQIRVAVTASGRDLIDRVTAHRRREIEELLAGIPGDVQLAMVDGLTRLAVAAGEVPEREWSAGWELGREASES